MQPTVHAFRSGLLEAHSTMVVKDKQAPLARNLEGPVVDRLLVLEGTLRSSRRKVVQRLLDGSVDGLIDLAGTDQAGLLLISRFHRRRDLYMPAGGYVGVNGTRGASPEPSFEGAAPRCDHGVMISFASLFLGLVTGVIPVTVMVAPEVARVEIHLDGKEVGVIDRKPWTFPLDLGEELSPHELVAVARDPSGRELGRARQWLNLPRPRAQLEVTLSGGAEGDPLVAQVAWESVGKEAPLGLRASLDGSPLDISEPARIQLPAVDPQEVHFLRVEAEFAEAGIVRRELVFGGLYTGETRTELSAVAVSLQGRGDVAPGDLRIEARGDAVPVAVVEKGAADLVIVVDPAALDAMPGLDSSTRPAGGQLTLGGRLATGPDARLTPRNPDDHLRLLWPVAVPTPAASPPVAAEGIGYRLFPSTPPDPPPAAGGLLWHLRHAQFPADDGRVRLADAVAVAGLMAAERGHRRAVLLLHGGTTDDGSDGARAVRRYLERLRVPLFVWSTRRPDPATLESWGDVEVVSGELRLQGAWGKLLRELGRQRVVWLEGIHLPQELVVVRGRVELAGAMPGIDIR